MIPKGKLLVFTVLILIAACLLVLSLQIASSPLVGAEASASSALDPTETPAEPPGRVYAYAPAVFQYDKLTATPTPPPTATPEVSPTPGPTDTPATP
jgi:hypothetical protein